MFICLVAANKITGSSLDYATGSMQLIYSDKANQFLKTEEGFVPDDSAYTPTLAAGDSIYGMGVRFAKTIISQLDSAKTTGKLYSLLGTTWAL